MEDVADETIADTYPAVTIMCKWMQLWFKMMLRWSETNSYLFRFHTALVADIAGFTAWSAEREPTQVFQLLENIYNTMDKIAKKLGVFKVETVGGKALCEALQVCL
jgi:hypothetical protein